MEIFDKNGKQLQFKDILAACTRVEVIDENGRVYVNWKPTNIVDISIQDNNKTLKIFICKNG